MKRNFLYKLQLPPEPLTRGLPPPDPRSVLCPQLNLLNPPHEQNSWVRHCVQLIGLKVAITDSLNNKHGHTRLFKLHDNPQTFKWRSYN